MLLVMREPRAAPITAESLAREHCVEVRAGMPPLTTEEAHALAPGVAGEWLIKGGELRREFTFNTFNAAFGLATRIALLAEAQATIRAGGRMGPARCPALDPLDWRALTQ
jgi:hypothetical protein